MIFSMLMHRSKSSTYAWRTCCPAGGYCYWNGRGPAVLAWIAFLTFSLVGIAPTTAQFGGPLPESAAVSGQADSDGDQQKTEEPAFRQPIEIVKEAIGEPPAGKPLSKDGRLWVDVAGKRVIVDGYVAMNEGPLEMFACPTQTKEHESVVAVLAKSQAIHAALLAIGTQQGTPVQFSPKFVPPTGQRVRVWVMWRDKKGKIQKTDAKKWVRKTGKKETLDLDWVFTGSRFWTDPSDGNRYYEADSGDLICVSNFGSAMMDLPTKSSKDTGQLQFQANTDRVPEPMTPVRLILVPIPVPADDPEPLPPGVADPNELPEDRWLPEAKTSAAIGGESKTSELPHEPEKDPS